MEIVSLDLGLIALITAFLAGMASFLSPCVLPLVPGYLSYLAGDGQVYTQVKRSQLLGRSVCFVAGFSLVFIALGASLSYLGQLLMAYRYELNVAAGVMVALAGLSVMGVLRMPMSLQRYYRFESGKAAGPGGATVMGLAFGFGWTPCIGPILAGILMMGASTASAGKASILLSVYALGLGVPFILAACFLTPLLAAHDPDQEDRALCALGGGSGADCDGLGHGNRRAGAVCDLGAQDLPGVRATGLTSLSICLLSVWCFISYQEAPHCHFTAALPPSANKAEPVTKLDMGLARKSAADAISSGWAIRFMACSPAAQSLVL